MSAIRHFLSDERGVETVEFIVWVPFICFLLVIVTDASFLYLSQTQMWNVARDTARRMNTGDLTSEADAKSFAKGQLDIYHNDYDVVAHTNSSYVRVVITAPVAEIVPFGMFTKEFLGQLVIAQVIMRKS